MVEISRTYRINMPQMAMGGLSESWLFKEMGDMHWELITEGLGIPSSALADASGNRLYSTFTRIRFLSDVPLSYFCENALLEAKGSIARFGASYFFSNLVFTAGDKTIQAELMSTFTKRSDEKSNVALMKGQPKIPADCRVPILEESPVFASEFRQFRDVNERPHDFSTEYHLQPCHDINGVGLLYFATYPSISDLCELRSEPDPATCAMSRSTVARDIFYSANCDIHDAIVYRRHEHQAEATTQRSANSLSRKSDGKLMAYVVTERAPFEA